MKKVLALALVALFAYDIAADTLSADCHAEPTACHSCVCGPHAVQPSQAHTIVGIPMEHRVSFQGIQFSQHLFDKSLFHPPKALA